MEGIIRIENYKIRCVIGSHAYERENAQDIAFDVEMKVNLLECAQTDSIVDTINYEEIAKTVRNLVEHKQFHLLETLAYETVHGLMQTFSPLWVRVKVKQDKPLPGAERAVVELELSQ